MKMLAHRSEKTLRSGTRWPFNCCGAGYRKATKANTHLMNNRHGIFIVMGKVGEEKNDNHIVKHVETRAGTLTISIRRTHDVSGSLL